MQLTPTPFAKRRVAQSGFTLVELVLALGILASGLVSVLGLLPVGLSTFQRAKTNTVESQIVQALSNDILLTEFSSLDSLSSQTFQFDNEGKTIPEIGAEPSIYSARIVLNQIESKKFPLSLQAASANSSSEAYSVQIRITNSTQPGKENIYSVIVANNNI